MTKRFTIASNDRSIPKIEKADMLSKVIFPDSFIFLLIKPLSFSSIW